MYQPSIVEDSTLQYDFLTIKVHNSHNNTEWDFINHRGEIAYTMAFVSVSFLLLL